MKSRAAYLAAVAALSALIGSCAQGPTAGDLSVTLTTPNNDDGAIQFVAHATSPNTVTGLSSACSGCKLFVVKVSDTEYEGVVTGAIAAGTLFRLGVSDTGNTSNYSVQITGISSRTYVLRSPNGYSIALQ